MRLGRSCASAGALVVSLIAIWVVPAGGSVDGSEPVEHVATIGNHYFAGLAIDRFDNAYVVDRANARVLRVTPDGEVSTIAGGNGVGAASDQLDYPYDVAVDRRGNVFVSDFHNHRVQRIAPDGSITTIIGGPVDDPAAGVALWLPTALAADHLGNVYVADNGGRVLRVSPHGEVVLIAGGNGLGSGPDQLDGVAGLALDLLGNVYINDSHNHRIQKVSATDGVVTTLASTGRFLSDVWFVAADGRGGIYASGPLSAGVLKVGADGRAALIVENEESPPGLSMWPMGLAFDSAGSLHIVDQKTDSILVMRNTTPPGPRQVTGPFASTAGIDGSIARLYMAVLGRQPDLAGYDYWVEEAANGVGLSDIAYQFLVASEYQRIRSSLSDAEFVDRLYLDVMGRSGDPAGMAYWIDVLGRGVDRATVLLLFSESTEFKRHTRTN